MADNPVIGSHASIPNPSLRPLSFLIGEWRTSGTHPLVPGKELSGRTSFAWHEGGAFLIMRQQVDEPGFPDGTAIIGSDQAAGTLTMIYFDERGVSRTMAVSAGEGSVSWTHEEPGLAQTLTIAADGDRLTSRGRMSVKGGPWTDDLSQLFERVG